MTHEPDLRTFTGHSFHFRVSSCSLSMSHVSGSTDESGVSGLWRAIQCPGPYWPIVALTLLTLFAIPKDHRSCKDS
jgi:hypothetical protein